MALFSISRGYEASLPTGLTDGKCYFTKDRNYLYLDYYDSDNNLVRRKLSAEFADKLRYLDNGTMTEIEPEQLALNNYELITTEEIDVICGQ